MIQQGGTIGILGGGQLGRMMATAAAQLGFRCHIYAPEQDSIAADVGATFTCAAWDDAEAMARFVADCDVITLEFENIPVGPLAAIPAGKLAPGVNALEVAQDRLKEKHFVVELGGRPAPFAAVNSREDLDAAIATIGTPGILKTTRDGYDGKGQWRINSPEDAAAIPFSGVPLVYEGFVQFDEDGILARSTLPAGPTITPHIAAARKLATEVAIALDYVGVLTLEFFATAEGPVFNEMAPRVHNSGHWTIEGSITSQFENHIRAVCGLPLGNTGLAATRVEMRNLIGDEASDIVALLSDPANRLHLYGKAEAREGRKMGHVTRLAWV